MIPFLAHFLIILAAWTLVIKYIFPVAMALAQGVPIVTYIYWDFWWVAHLWLAWALLNWQRYTVALAVGVSVVEIIIVVTKFILFFGDPQWTIWTTNWFINKVFVLACFCMLLPAIYVAVRSSPFDKNKTGGRPPAMSSGRSRTDNHNTS